MDAAPALTSDEQPYRPLCTAPQGVPVIAAGRGEIAAAISACDNVDMAAPSTTPSSQGPAHRYYLQCEGLWRSSMNARVTQMSALIAAMGWLNALSVMMMAFWPSWLGGFNLETKVVYEPTQPVEHTTIVYWLGVAMMTSEELVTIASDGVHFEVRGESRIRLMPWRALTMEGHGHVDASGTQATYQLSWMGTHMTQTTRRHADGCLLRQDAPGFSAVQDLRPKRSTPQR